MFNIAALSVAATAAIHLKGLDNEYLYDKEMNPVTITVYSPGSKEFAAVEDRQTSRALKRMADNDGKPTAASPEQRAAEAAEDLAALTVSFDHFEYPPAAGKTGQELFEAFYADRTLGHLHQQVLKAVQNWGNFKAASANG